MGGRRNCGKEPMARDDLAEGQRLRGGQATCAAGSARSDSELVVPKKCAAAYPVAAFGSVKRVVHGWLDRQSLGTALTAAKCCFSRRPVGTCLAEWRRGVRVAASGARYADVEAAVDIQGLACDFSRTR